MTASVLLLAVALPTFAGPSDDLVAAVHDVETRVAVEARSHTRYVSFANLAPSERAEAAAVLSFVLNSVSRADVIVRPVAVPDTDERLWRISLADYALPAEVWEFLASHDPYRHIRTRVLATATAAKQAAAKPTAQTIVTDGGWVDLVAAAKLREFTQSSGALLRGDYFIAKATTTIDGGVYYELAGIGADEAAFFGAIGIDVRTIDRLRADEGANTIRSLVTFKPRRVVRRQGPLGGAWHTYDTAAATPERDPIRNPTSFVYDAGEHIAAKRNGLHLYALFDAAGKRQASVPDVIAQDTSDPHGAGIVVPMISCVRCHLEDGLRPIANDQRKLLTSGAELYAASPTEAQRLASFYLSDLEKRLARDRDDFAAAVSQATGGLKPAVVSAALARRVRLYQDELIDRATAARELGVDEATFAAAMRSSHDPLLLGLVAEIGVGRKQWDASFAEAALLVAAARGAAMKPKGN